MTLRVLPVEDGDFDEIIAQSARGDLADDLVGQPVLMSWPVTTAEEAHQRCLWHFARQRARCLGDSSVRYMKVVKESEHGSSQIIAIARWHYYESGFTPEISLPWDLASGEAQSIFDRGMHNEILEFVMSARESWVLPCGEPCWVLTNTVTQSSNRGQGAATLLVKWGMEQAAKAGAPAYLEAGPLGVRIFERCGFEKVGDKVLIQLAGGLVVDYVCMKYDPLQKLQRVD